MITRPVHHGSTAVKNRRQSNPIEHYQLFNFDRYKWCRLAKSKKLNDFLFRLHEFFGVISRNNHVPVLFAHAETIIALPIWEKEKIPMSMRTFRRRMKAAIEKGFFISTEGKDGRLIYIAKFPEQKNTIHILKNAIEKCETKLIFNIIPYLKNAIKKITTLNSEIRNEELESLPQDFASNSVEVGAEKIANDKKIGTQIQETGTQIPDVWHSDSNHSINPTDYFTDLGTGTITEAEEPPIEHPENSDQTFTRNLEKVFNASKTKIPNPIIQELVKIWSVYRPAETIEHLKTKIKRFNEGRWYPNKVIQMLRDDGLTWHLKDRSRYQTEHFGTHDAASIGLRKSSSYWEALEEKQKPKVVHPTPEPPPKPSNELKTKWGAILLKLKENLAPHVFVSWFETAMIPLKIHANETILMLSDDFFVEHVTKKYLGFLQYTLGTDNVRLITYDDGRLFLKTSRIPNDQKR